MNYNLTELPVLGQGRFGTVYKADEKTALKVINVGPNKDLKTMALEEVEWLMRLNRQDDPGSEHIVTITGYENLPDRIFIKMELAAGGSMADFMTKACYAELSLKAKTDVIGQGFYGLEFLHSRHPVVVHQDVKPHNVLLFPNLLLKLCDFGFVRAKTHSSLTMTAGVPIGTVSYMAPELLVGIPSKEEKIMAQPFSDVWSMSCTAVEWFTGRFPWTLESKANVKKEIKAKQRAQAPPDALCLVPDLVRDVLACGLNYDCSNRPSSGEMKQRFVQLSQSPLSEEVPVWDNTPPQDRDGRTRRDSSSEGPPLLLTPASQYSLSHLSSLCETKPN